MRVKGSFLLLILVVLISSCSSAPVSNTDIDSSDSNSYKIINNNKKASPEQCYPNGIDSWDFLFDHVCISVRGIYLRTNLSQNDNGLYSEIIVAGLLNNVPSGESYIIDLQPKLTNQDGTQWELWKNWKSSYKYNGGDYDPANGVFSLGPNNVSDLGVKFFSDELSPSLEGYVLTFTTHDITVTYELDALLP